jgi:rare lipoprotein A
VDVRINDRGPYIGARELDLSYGAAKQIGLTHPGVDYVSFTYL